MALRCYLLICKYSTKWLMFIHNESRYSMCAALDGNAAMKSTMELRSHRSYFPLLLPVLGRC